MLEKEALLILNHLTLKQGSMNYFDSALAYLSSLPKTLWEKALSWQEDLRIVEQEGIDLIGITENDYPKNLRALKDPPLLLYVKGNPKTLNTPSLGIVGTRRCSLYGKEMAEKIAFQIAGAGLAVVSGLARGIDTAAHVGALAGGTTIAILGSGLSHIYPPENKNLACQVVKSGALVSELPMKTGPKPYHFPKRNRLIAALSLGVLLVEGPEKSGGMITLALAGELQKKCFALPGRADIETFKGNHSLIKKGKAALVENGQEMVSLLAPGKTVSPEKDAVTLFDLEEDEKKLLDNFPNHEISLEELLLKTEFPVAKLNARLLSLCLKGAVRELPGKLYKKGC